MRMGPFKNLDKEMAEAWRLHQEALKRTVADDFDDFETEEQTKEENDELP